MSDDIVEGAYGILEKINNDTIQKLFKDAGVINFDFFKELISFNIMKNTKLVPVIKKIQYETKKKQPYINMECYDLALDTFVYNYCRGDYKNMTGEQYVNVIFDVISSIYSSLLFSHQCGIIHNDVKPPNIVFNMDTSNDIFKVTKVALIDWGLSVFTFLDELKDSHTTRDFNNPNKKDDTVRTRDDDWWSLTVTMLYPLLERYCNYDDIFDHNNYTKKNQPVSDLMSIGLLGGKLNTKNKKKFKNFIKNNKKFDQNNYQILQDDIKLLLHQYSFLKILIDNPSFDTIKSVLCKYYIQDNLFIDTHTDYRYRGSGESCFGRIALEGIPMHRYLQTSPLYQ